jgi:hypothetical protein
LTRIREINLNTYSPTAGKKITVYQQSEITSTSHRQTVGGREDIVSIVVGGRIESEGGRDEGPYGDCTVAVISTGWKVKERVEGKKGMEIRRVGGSDEITS